MRRFTKAIFVLIASLFAGFIVLFWLAYLSDRPISTIEPAVLLGDGSALNYCELQELDGLGKRADQIPKGNTPGCAYEHFPLPILQECREPLEKGSDDIRGLWQVVEGKRLGHVERIEQCGSRTVVTAAGIIHDYGPNSSAGLNTDDTEGAVLFTAGQKEYCMRTSASMIWNDGVLDFHVFGWGPVVVKRYLDEDQLIWEYADGSVNRMDRICRVPEAHIVPPKRGKRIKLF